MDRIIRKEESDEARAVLSRVASGLDLTLQEIESLIYLAKSARDGDGQFGVVDMARWSGLLDKVDLRFGELRQSGALDVINLVRERRGRRKSWEKRERAWPAWFLETQAVAIRAIHRHFRAPSALELVRELAEPLAIWHARAYWIIGKCYQVDRNLLFTWSAALARDAAPKLQAFQLCVAIPFMERYKYLSSKKVNDFLDLVVALMSEGQPEPVHEAMEQYALLMRTPRELGIRLVGDVLECSAPLTQIEGFKDHLLTIVPELDGRTRIAVARAFDDTTAEFTARQELAQFFSGFDELHRKLEELRG